jgi:transcriptional regulator with XRE-family HTH domain
LLENLFPSRIRQLRTAKKPKMTQQRLALAVGVDIRTIRRWEKGEHWPGPGEIQALAKALGVHIWELFIFPEHPDL